MAWLKNSKLRIKRTFRAMKLRSDHTFEQSTIPKNFMLKLGSITLVRYCTKMLVVVRIGRTYQVNQRMQGRHNRPGTMVQAMRRIKKTTMSRISMTEQLKPMTRAVRIMVIHIQIFTPFLNLVMALYLSKISCLAFSSIASSCWLMPILMSLFLIPDPGSSSSFESLIEAGYSITLKSETIFSLAWSRKTSLLGWFKMVCEFEL